MLKVLMFISLLFLLVSCSPKIVRHGYEVMPQQNANCEIAITKDGEFFTDETEVISKIDIGDTGFTINCDESEIIKILKAEGCSINADIINVTKEKRPGFFSSCYCASADFLRVKENVSNKPEIDETMYQEPEINKRVKKDKIKRYTTNAIAFVIGFFIGFSN